MERVLPPSPEIFAKTPSVTYSPHEEGKLSPIVEVKTSPIEQRVEVPPKNVQKIAAEFIGTFILIFIGCGSGFIDQRHNITILGIAFAWGLTVMAMLYTVGHISGGHFNPAVTIAFAIIGNFPWKQVLGYVMAQLLGSILASISLRWLFDGDQPKVMLTLPAPKTDDLTVIAFEIITSFILMWVISGAASDRRAIKELSGAAVGAAIFLDVLVIGKVTGASMNPARSIGPAIAAHYFRKLWIYIVSPVIGTVAASTLYTLLGSPNKLQKTFKHPPHKIKSTLNPAYSSGKEMELP